jgi:hypothetical protein
MTSRDEQVQQIALDLRIRSRVFALRRLAALSAGAFEKADAELVRELRKLIDDGKPNSNV